MCNRLSSVQKRKRPWSKFGPEEEAAVVEDVVLQGDGNLAEVAGRVPAEVAVCHVLLVEDVAHGVGLVVVAVAHCHVFDYLVFAGIPAVGHINCSRQRDRVVVAGFPYQSARWRMRKGAGISSRQYFSVGPIFTFCIHSCFCFLCKPTARKRFLAVGGL